MPSYSVVEAKNTLPRLIDRALAGEKIAITRHGKVVAEVRGVVPFDREAWLRSIQELSTMRQRTPPLQVGAAELLRAMYDESPW